MPESELIDKVSRRLREREFKIRKGLKMDGLYSPWDADVDEFSWVGALSLKAAPEPKKVILSNGEIALLVGTKPPKERGLIFLFHDFVTLCRLKGKELVLILDTIKILGCQRMFLSKTDGSPNDVSKYCLEMDEVIKKMTFFMRQNKVANFYEKIGNQIGNKDMLGQRIRTLHTLVEHYKIDKATWRPEVDRLGLIG